MRTIKTSAMLLKDEEIEKMTGKNPRFLIRHIKSGRILCNQRGAAIVFGAKSKAKRLRNAVGPDYKVSPGPSHRKYRRVQA